MESSRFFINLIFFIWLLLYDSFILLSYNKEMIAIFIFTEAFAGPHILIASTFNKNKIYLSTISRNAIQKWFKAINLWKTYLQNSYFCILLISIIIKIRIDHILLNKGFTFLQIHHNDQNHDNLIEMLLSYPYTFFIILNINEDIRQSSLFCCFYGYN